MALVNAQTMRTTVIAGRPDIGQPDWRGYVPGHPLTDDDVTDVTAWLMAQRPLSGQPYPILLRIGILRIRDSQYRGEDEMSDEL